MELKSVASSTSITELIARRSLRTRDPSPPPLATQSAMARVGRAATGGVPRVNAQWLERGASALVFVAAASSALRMALQRPIRRELQSHPVVGGIAMLLVLSVVAVGSYLAVQSAMWRRVLCAVVVAGWLLFWFHARIAYGRRRGWPPGSLGFTASMQAIEDPDFYAKATAAFGPVFKMQQAHRPC